MFQFISLVNWSLLAEHLCMRPIYRLLLAWLDSFLTHQLIHKSKIEKHNVSLDIFVSDTSIVRNHLPGLEKKHFSYIRTILIFCLRFWYLCCSKSKNIWGSEPYHRDKKKSALISIIGKMIIHMGRIQAKGGLGCFASAIRFIL